MKGGSPAVRCAAFLYGFMLDGDAVTATATASAQFGFATPCASRGIDDVRDDAAVLIVRAGQDQFAGLNDTIDRFATGALRRNLPATLMNLPASPHAFDLFADDGASHVAIDAVLAFLRSHLGT
jgi:hypothetical protein